MLKHIPEYQMYVLITGFRSVAPENPELLLKELRAKNDAEVAVQLFNAGLIATWEHLYFAVVDALMAFGTNRNISKNLSVEIMLYASAQRQIKKAISVLGVREDCSGIGVVIVSRNPQGVEAAKSLLFRDFGKETDDSVLTLSTEKAMNIRKVFGITDQELEAVMKQGDWRRALVDMIIERMALLATRI